VTADTHAASGEELGEIGIKSFPFYWEIGNCITFIAGKRL